MQGENTQNQEQQVQQEQEQQQEQPMQQVQQNTRQQRNSDNHNYKVVFYVRYYTQRPTEQVIADFFNNYGQVDHVTLPEDKNFGFVYMTSLNAQGSMQTQQVINAIIKEIRQMDPNDRFYIGVARRNKTPNNRTYTRDTDRGINRNDAPSTQQNTQQNTQQRQLWTNN